LRHEATQRKIGYDHAITGHLTTAGDRPAAKYVSCSAD
jgi:hypothetical protein